MQSDCKVEESSIIVLSDEGSNVIKLEHLGDVLYVTVTVITDHHCAGRLQFKPRSP